MNKVFWKPIEAKEVPPDKHLWQICEHRIRGSLFTHYFYPIGGHLFRSEMFWEMDIHQTKWYRFE